MEPIDKSSSIELTIPEHRLDEINPLVFSLFGKSIPDLTFEEATQLITILYDLHTNPDSGTASYEGRVVADSHKDGREVLDGVMTHARKELSRLAIEGSEAIINIKDSILMPDGTYVKGSDVIEQYRFPRT